MSRTHVISFGWAGIRREPESGGFGICGLKDGTMIVAHWNDGFWLFPVPPSTPHEADAFTAGKATDAIPVATGPVKFGAWRFRATVLSLGEG